jgi:hypothetical protein
LKSIPFTINKPAPVRKGVVRLMFSNMYPAKVGASVRRLIRTELLTPMAVAISLGSTIPVAKDCLMGIENIITTLNPITKMTAKLKDVVKDSNMARQAVTRREAMRVCTSPKRFVTMGTKM